MHQTNKEPERKVCVLFGGPFDSKQLLRTVSRTGHSLETFVPQISTLTFTVTKDGKQFTGYYNRKGDWCDVTF